MCGTDCRCKATCAPAASTPHAAALTWGLYAFSCPDGTRPDHRAEDLAAGELADAVARAVALGHDSIYLTRL